MNDTHFDIIIIGGGMVGASLACALASPASTSTFRVLLVEAFALMDAAQPRGYQPSFDARSTALSLSSAQFYTALGLWERIREHAEAITRIHVSDRGRFGSTVLDAAAESLPALGYVVENHWLGNVLHGGLHHCAGLEILAPATVVSLEPGEQGVLVGVRHGQQEQHFSAALAVIADGARSALAARLGIGMVEEQYAQSALIANVLHAKVHGGWAFERFCTDGPLAMLPLPDNVDGSARSALVWTLPQQEVAATLALSDADFLKRLQLQFGYRLGRFLRVGARQAYPLNLLRVREQIRSNVVLLGNAAHTLHPVAGQGFNLSLRDVAEFAIAMDSARRRQLALGSLEVLEAYVTAQHADQERTIGLSDLLPRMFGSGQLPLALARDAGLIGMELLPALRTRFVRAATGLAGR